MRALSVLLLAGALPAAAEFQLLTLDGMSPLPVPPLQDLGTVARGETRTARYRLRNAGVVAAPLRSLEVAGAGYSLAQTVALPLNMAPGASLDFTVLFRSDSEGTYSAVLRSEGVSALLLVKVVAQLTLALETPAGAPPLATGAVIDCGTAERGSAVTRRLLIRNQTGRDQIIPPIGASGEDFGLEASPSGQTLRHQEEARLAVRFTPSAAATRHGTLAFGTRTFVLRGTGSEPPPPQPRLTLGLPDPAASGQQGMVRVLLEGKSRTSGKGVVTMSLRPLLPGATDPAAVFSTGTRSAEFSFSEGDDRAWFGNQAGVGFQTGATAGTLIFSLRLGELTDERRVEIGPAAPSLSAVEGVRTPGGLEVRISGFDNTRTAGPLSFTFYNREGAPIAPGPIRADASGDFGRYFQTSDAGGLFLLRASFPVTGDASAIASVQVELENSSGTARKSTSFGN